MKKTIIIILLASLLIAAVPHQAPNQPVKLIFIHHSTGENWLTDGYGNLGKTLGENNYFVSDTNYGWGPNGIGDRTDIPDWVEWFASDETPTYMNALFNEYGQNASYTRNLSDPGGENMIIMFKSCFPNSDLEGNPNDPPGDYEELTVAGAKYVYNTILETFAMHPDKLFIAITAPPLSDPTNSANARAFNNWLVNEWLANYEGSNVAVFDFYDVLTGPNGGDTLYYPSDDDHPNEEGSRIATAEFLPQLNTAYKRWQAGDTSAPPADSEPAPAESAESQPEASSAPAPSSDILDDFENGAPAGSYGWESYASEDGDTRISCTQTDEQAHEGAQSMRVDFNVAPYSWSTCDLTFQEAQNWRESEGLHFFIHAQKEDVFLNIGLFVHTESGVSTYLYPVSVEASALSGWQEVSPRWDEFKRVDWEENPGSTFDQPERVTTLTFGFDAEDATNTGVAYIDDLSLLNGNALEPATPQPEVETAPIESPAEEETPSGSPLPCVGGLVLPLGLVGLAFARKKEK